jgi:hypothetical protein
MAIDRLANASVYPVLRDAEPPQLGTHKLAAEPQTAVGVREEAEPANKNRSGVPRYRSWP